MSSPSPLLLSHRRNSTGKHFTAIQCRCRYIVQRNTGEEICSLRRAVLHNYSHSTLPTRPLSRASSKHRALEIHKVSYSLQPFELHLNVAPEAKLSQLHRCCIEASTASNWPSARIDLATSKDYVLHGQHCLDLLSLVSIAAGLCATTHLPQLSTTSTASELGSTIEPAAAQAAG